MIIYHENHKAQPKNFTNISKKPKPRSKMHECMEREKIRTLTKCFELEIGPKRGG